MTLEAVKIELGSAYNQALLSAKAKGTSLSDAFIFKGQMEALKYALSLLEKVEEPEAATK